MLGSVSNARQWLLLAGVAAALSCSTEPFGPSLTPSIVSDSIDVARAGDPYQASLSAEGGQGTLTWELKDAGPFADWLKIAPAHLGGIPLNKMGEAQITILVRDEARNESTRTFNLSVQPCAPGREIQCNKREDNQCKQGSQKCIDGSFEPCVATGEAKSELEGCGPECRDCTGIGDRCSPAGVCECGEGGAVCGEDQICCFDQDKGRNCKDPRTDVTACGACRPCADKGHNTVTTCTAGQCTYPCAPGFANCSGDPNVSACDTPVTTIQNCGTCGNTCGPVLNGTPTCNGTACVARCSGTFSSCGKSYELGCPFNLATDLTHCGSCDTDCSNKPNVRLAACENGGCRIVACEPGFSDCDRNPSNGCETLLGQIPNCNYCGNDCSFLPPLGATPVCRNFSCEIGACAAGRGDCNADVEDGCETPLNTQSNCGACGRACSGKNAIGLPYLCNPTLLRCCPAGGNSGCL